MALRAAGISSPILFSPVMRIVDVTPPDLPVGTLVFTSRHAVARAVALGLRTRPALAVGPATGRVARAAGITCRDGPGDVAALARMILGEIDGPILHLHGRHLASDLAHDLRKAGRIAEARIVYDQVTGPLTPAARAALAADGTILPLYSPRSARAAAAGLVELAPRLRVVAISQSVARAWPTGGPVHIATRPDGHAMVSEMASLVAANTER